MIGNDNSASQTAKRFSPYDSMAMASVSKKHSEPAELSITCMTYGFYPAKGR
jgi:hypothetical protein